MIIETTGIFIGAIGTSFIYWLMKQDIHQPTTYKYVTHRNMIPENYRIEPLTKDYCLVSWEE